WAPLRSALQLRGDQSVVLIAPLVQHADLLGLAVAEDDELVLAVLELEGRLLDAHRLHRQPARLDAAQRPGDAALAQALPGDDVERPVVAVALGALLAPPAVHELLARP